ncbi:hypothetical protein GCM10010095_71090 [Streptomyces anthocyanicus]|uniref:Uncharacterized protein n=1 Tax=Streptomyces violaceolatus TaxID=67378 RepID=A0ABN3TCG2_9ACTN|nr:hypothetical protein [Streptomyces anthocyanicus]GGL75809.1 hypothetical protein GCM10010095_71090 [Streptomyces anthocyanicus]
MAAQNSTTARLPLDQTQRVMAIIIGLLSGIIAALMAFVLSRHLGGVPLVGMGYSGGSFIAASTLVIMIEKELGFL